MIQASERFFSPMHAHDVTIATVAIRQGTQEEMEKNFFRDIMYGTGSSVDLAQR